MSIHIRSIDEINLTARKYPMVEYSDRDAPGLFAKVNWEHPIFTPLGILLGWIIRIINVH